MQRQQSRRAEAVGLPQARGRMVAGRVLTHHRWLPHGVRWSVGWVCPKGCRPQAGSVSERRPQAGSVSERGPLGVCTPTRCPLAVCSPTRCPLTVCATRLGSGQTQPTRSYPSHHPQNQRGATTTRNHPRRFRTRHPRGVCSPTRHPRGVCSPTRHPLGSAIRHATR